MFPRLSIGSVCSLKTVKYDGAESGVKQGTTFGVLRTASDRHYVGVVHLPVQRRALRFYSGAANCQNTRPEIDSGYQDLLSGCGPEGQHFDVRRARSTIGAPAPMRSQDRISTSQLLDSAIFYRFDFRSRSVGATGETHRIATLTIRRKRIAGVGECNWDY